MINSKKIIFILLIISSALATKNVFSASRIFKTLGTLGKRGKPGDDTPAGIAAPDVLTLPTTEEELENLEHCSLDLAIPDKDQLAIPSDPFETREEQATAKRPAKAGSRASMSPEELATLRKREAAAKAARLAKMTAKQRADYKKKQVENQAKNRAKMPPDERAAFREKQAAAKAARLVKKTADELAALRKKAAAAEAARLDKMTAKQREEYNARKAAVQHAYRARKKDKETKKAV